MSTLTAPRHHRVISAAIHLGYCIAATSIIASDLVRLAAIDLKPGQALLPDRPPSRGKLPGTPGRPRLWPSLPRAWRGTRVPAGRVAGHVEPGAYGADRRHVARRYVGGELLGGLGL